MIVVSPDTYTMFINDGKIPLSQTNFRSNGEIRFGGHLFETALGQIRLSEVQAGRLRSDESEPGVDYAAAK